MNLDSSYLNLDDLKQEDIIEMLKKQKGIVQSNFSSLNKYLTKYSNKEELYIDVLQTYLSTDAEYRSEFRINETKHKNNSLLHSMDSSKIKENEFFEILEVLYWEQLIKPIASNIMLLRKDRVADDHFKRLKIEYNLKKIYNKYPELFSDESLGGTIKIDTKYTGEEIEKGKLRAFITGLEPEKEVECEKNLNSLLKYGQILNLVLSPTGLTSLSSLGFNTLNSISLKESAKHIKEQNEVKEEIEKVKNEQINISQNMTGKVEDFYKNITTLLSLLVAAFSFIGVNISAIPEIKENFTINIITLNASLILVISIIFLFLNSIIGKNKITNKAGIGAIISISLVFIIVGFIFGAVMNKSDEEKVKEHIKNISKENMLIEKEEYRKITEEINLLKQRISELESENPKSN